MMISALRIRALAAADVKPLARVLARAYESPHNFELPLEGYLRRRAAATFVADAEGRPAGLVIGNDYGSTAYVSMMGVDPALQRRGIGSSLMNGLLAWARERGFAAIELDATPSGRELYAAFGFAQAGRTLVYVAAARGVRRRARGAPARLGGRRARRRPACRAAGRRRRSNGDPRCRSARFRGRPQRRSPAVARSAAQHGVRRWSARRRRWLRGCPTAIRIARPGRRDRCRHRGAADRCGPSESSGRASPQRPIRQ
jgi:ribosomal protein S18 acetylase RimI-like enzyme